MGLRMSTTPTFHYDKFVTLADHDLAVYMEPLVIDPATRISRDVLDRMLVELPTYDEYHLVYALQLGADHSPDTFLPIVPQYLAHEEASVCCTAFNILNKLPYEYVTQDLVDSVRKVPVIRMFFTKPDSGSRGYMGTNSKFVAEILDSLDMRMREEQKNEKGSG